MESALEWSAGRLVLDIQRTSIEIIPAENGCLLVDVGSMKRKFKMAKHSNQNKTTKRTISTVSKEKIAERIAALMHNQPRVKVELNKRLPPINGKGRKREIDVLLTVDVTGYPVQMAIECKNECDVIAKLLLLKNERNNSHGNIDSQGSNRASQRVKLYEDGVLLLIDAEKHTEIKLDAQSSMQVFDFLLLHQDRLTRHARSNEHQQQ